MKLKKFLSLINDNHFRDYLHLKQEFQTVKTKKTKSNSRKNYRG